MISVSCRGRRLYRAQKILTGRDLSAYCTGLYVHFFHHFAQLVLCGSHSAKTELHEETRLQSMAITGTKWNYKLYLEGKVQREHFFRSKALRISLSPTADPLFQIQNQFCKAGKIPWPSSVGLKMADFPPTYFRYIGEILRDRADPECG
jgi:hypothetical protein